MRVFGLNSREFYEAVCEPRERPWIPNGALPREPRRPRPLDGVWVSAETACIIAHANACCDFAHPLR